jgi:cytochrome c biogenesis protein CcmG, thiol:disulfide interchange protein DsbE
MSELTSNSSTNIAGTETSAKARPRWGKILAWSGLGIVLLILGFGLYNTYRGPVVEGSPVPGFTLTTFDGNEISLSQYQGKVVVINFWASWCKPCEQEAADLETAWRLYQPGGEVIFIGIAYVDTEPKSLAYLQRFNITYPNGPDLRTQISHSYRIRGVPETFFIDQSGVLVKKKVGPFTHLNEITSVIDTILEK